MALGGPASHSLPRPTSLPTTPRLEPAVPEAGRGPGRAVNESGEGAQARTARGPPAAAAQASQEEAAAHLQTSFTEMVGFFCRSPSRMKNSTRGMKISKARTHWKGWAQ